MNEACWLITQPGYQPLPAGNERELHRRLENGLSKHEPITEGRLADHGRGWARKPGGIDVVAIGLSLGIEVKLDKPEELLLDAIKIGQRVESGPGWDKALGTAALVVQTTIDRMQSPTAYMLWPTAPKTFDVHALLDEQRKDWYWLMCGGRGVRPTDLPRHLHASETQVHPYQESPDTVLAVRTFQIPKSDASNRFDLDGHGWPDGIAVPRAWRDRIDYCATREPPVKLELAIPTRRKPIGEKDVHVEHLELLEGEGKRVWTFVWSPGFKDPTSFRLTPEDPDRYDLRIASNGAVTNPGAPKPLPKNLSQYP